MLGRPRLYTSYEAETAIFPTWTQRIALVLLLVVGFGFVLTGVCYFLDRQSRTTTVQSHT